MSKHYKDGDMCFTYLREDSIGAANLIMLDSFVSRQKRNKIITSNN